MIDDGDDLDDDSDNDNDDGSSRVKNKPWKAILPQSHLWNQN